MQITQLPKQARPRERLLQFGPSALNDAELLAIFLRTGIRGCNAIELASSLLEQSGGLQGLLGASKSAFCQHKGLGEAKYVQLQACLELSRRYLREPCVRETAFHSPNAVREYLQLTLAGLDHEVFMVLYLDAQHRLIADEALFRGTINAASVYPRDVVKSVLEKQAAAVIFAHNHPSGVAEPSQADKLITDKLVAALGLIDVAVLDHLVVAKQGICSFAERGWL